MTNYKICEDHICVFEDGITLKQVAKTKCPCIVNQDFYESTYGFPLNDYEINHFKTHYNTWKHFSEHSEDEWCLIYEDGVTFNKDSNEIKSALKSLPSGTDLFFPYDKLLEVDKMVAPEICTSKLGFFWGSYIYFLNKAGANKLLEITQIQKPVDEEIIELGFTGRLATISADTNWFEYDDASSPSYKARKKALTDAIMNYPAWTPKQKNKARIILKHLVKHAEKLDIKLILHAGTLLGGIRHGGIMPWDDDIDLVMPQQDIERFVESIKQEGTVRVTTFVFKKTNSTYYKFWMDDGEVAEGFEYKFPFIDIWLLYFHEDGEISLTDGYKFPQEKYLPGKHIDFEECKLYTPTNHRMVLNEMYSDWHTKIRIFAWCHRLKKSLFKRLILPIKTDDHGRLVEN